MQTALINTVLLCIAHRAMIIRSVRETSLAEFANVLRSVGLAPAADTHPVDQVGDSVVTSSRTPSAVKGPE